MRAFEIRGELAEAESPRRVRIEITNASDRPQILPLLPVRGVRVTAVTPI